VRLISDSQSKAQLRTPYGDCRHSRVRSGSFDGTGVGLFGWFERQLAGQAEIAKSNGGKVYFRVQLTLRAGNGLSIKSAVEDSILCTDGVHSIGARVRGRLARSGLGPFRWLER
jgi:hypothetical protein